MLVKQFAAVADARCCCDVGEHASNKTCTTLALGTPLVLKPVSKHETVMAFSTAAFMSALGVSRVAVPELLLVKIDHE